MFHPYNTKIIHYKYHSRHICSTNIVAFVIPLTKIHAYLQPACAHTPPSFELLAVNTAEAATQQQGKNKLSSQNGP